MLPSSGWMISSSRPVSRFTSENELGGVRWRGGRPRSPTRRIRSTRCFCSFFPADLSTARSIARAMEGPAETTRGLQALPPAGTDFENEIDHVKLVALWAARSACGRSSFRGRAPHREIRRVGAFHDPRGLRSAGGGVLGVTGGNRGGGGGPGIGGPLHQRPLVDHLACPRIALPLHPMGLRAHLTTVPMTHIADPYRAATG